MAKALAIVVLCASLGLAACGDDDDSADVSGTDQAETSAAASPPDEASGDGAGAGAKGGGKDDEGSEAKPGIEITTGGSQYGEVLFDSERRAIYYFDKESGPTSECYGDCAAAWPPVVTDGEPQAGGAVEQNLLGTTERDDGTTQVTYADRPLYYYVDDPVGEILCHNVAEFGGLWLAVEPSGEAVQ